MPLMGAIGNSLCLDLLGEHAQAVRKGSFFCPCFRLQLRLIPRGKEGFVPPPDLWEIFGQGQPAGKRKGTPPQGKEQFDQMEKSTAGLLEMIAQAKNAH